MTDAVGHAGTSSWREDLAGNSIFHRFVGERPHDQAVRALAVDGGGIRGILPALIGAELEDRTGKHLSELFDFVVGTSTGSIIALGLATPGPDGKPKWTAREGAEIYANRGHEIFSKPKFSTGVFHERYRHEGIEHLLDELWGDIMLSEALIDCVATSYELTTRRTHHFDSREAKSDPTRDVKMKTVVRAATAAPTFFEPFRTLHDKEPKILIDGAIYANNPAMVAFTEVQRAAATDMIIVSLGTGDEVEPMQWDHVRDWGLAQWARPILNVVFDSASQSVDYQLRHLLGPERYHRFQVPLHHASHRLDDCSPANMVTLAEEAGRMIEAHDVEIDHLCKKLVR